jgi:uncharacterized membrane protein YkvA (DUF1232 family)
VSGRCGILFNVSEDVVTIELNPRERRLYERFRDRVTGLENPGVTGFKDMIFLLPDLTILLARLMRDKRVPLKHKIIAGIGVGYVLSPIDLMPSLLLGPIGLIDDAVVVSAALSRVLNHVHPDIVRSHWAGKGDALDAVQRMSEWCESLFTGRLRDVVGAVLGNSKTR